jgi:valyl-tRNA synthetase
LVEVLGTLLRLLHPFMPFITEELWHKIPGADGFLATAEWPTVNKQLTDADAERKMDLLRELVVKARNLRAESRIEAGKRIELLLHPTDSDDRPWLAEQARLIGSLVRAAAVRVQEHPAPELPAARGVVRGVELAIPLQGVVDLDAVCKRLRRDLEKVERELAGRTKKLADESFLQRAPAKVVHRERELERELTERRRRIQENLSRIQGGAAGAP